MQNIGSHDCQKANNKTLQQCNILRVRPWIVQQCSPHAVASLPTGWNHFALTCGIILMLISSTDMRTRRLITILWPNRRNAITLLWVSVCACAFARVLLSGHLPHHQPALAPQTWPLGRVAKGVGGSSLSIIHMLISTIVIIGAPNGSYSTYSAQSIT